MPAAQDGGGQEARKRPGVTDGLRSQESAGRETGRRSPDLHARFPSEAGQKEIKRQPGAQVPGWHQQALDEAAQNTYTSGVMLRTSASARGQKTKGRDAPATAREPRPRGWEGQRWLKHVRFHHSDTDAEGTSHGEREPRPRGWEGSALAQACAFPPQRHRHRGNFQRGIEREPEPQPGAHVDPRKGRALTRGHAASRQEAQRHWNVCARRQDSRAGTLSWACRSGPLWGRVGPAVHAVWARRGVSTYPCVRPEVG